MNVECNVIQPQMEAADLMRGLVNRVKENPSDEKLKDVVSNCLLLLARIKEYRWTHNNIAHALFNILGNQQSLLLWVFKTLGMVKSRI